MQPKVTIILPVYNVEQYLRQCLDSVVNQTMREIQIVCVNDGSTDGSPAILEEYAAGDSRIEIIHQENQGGGSARNAAYPFIRGKYTYFVDPDDWIELDLCRQCYDKAEATEADIVALRCIEHKPYPKCSPPFDPMLPEVRQTPEERHEIIGLTATWTRFWRSDFLFLHNIRFSEGRRPSNDMIISWKGTVLANRIAILDSPLYHYRIRQGSYQQIIDEKHFVIIDTYNEVEKMLHETGAYETYKDVFCRVRLMHFYWVYDRFSRPLRSRFIFHVRQSLKESDREFCRTAPKKLLPNAVRLFYAMVDGDRVSTMRYHLFEMAKLPEKHLRHWIIKPLKKRLRAA